MKHIFRHITLLAATVLLALSCQKSDDTPLVQSGTLELTNIEIEGTYIQIDPSQALSSTAITKADVDISDHIFSVDIYDVDTDEIVESYSSHRDMPATIVLSAGTYRVEVYTADINSQVPFGTTVGFDQPQYGATQEVEITAAETTTIAVTALPITCGVTISYSDTFEYVFPCTNEGETYYTIVYSSHGAEITFFKGESRTAYFEYTGKGMELLYRVYIVRMNDEGTLETYTTDEPSTLLPSGTEATEGYIYNATIAIDSKANISPVE